MENPQPIPLAFQCPKRFEELSGCGASRFCESCQKSVTNISAFKSEDARAFLEANPQGTCIRYAAVDGQVVFAESPARRPRSGWSKGGRSLIAAAALGLPSMAAAEECAAPPAADDAEEEFILTGFMVGVYEQDFIGELSPFKVAPRAKNPRESAHKNSPKIRPNS